MTKSLLQGGYKVTLVAQKVSVETHLQLNVPDIVEYRPGALGKLQMLWRLLPFIWRQQTDVYHFHDPELLLLVPFLRRKGAVVYDVHENYAQSILENRQGGRFAPIISTLFSYIEKFMAAQCDAIIGATSEITSLFSKHKNSATIKNYAPIGRERIVLQAKSANEKKYDLVYIGGLARNRGLFDMLDALQKMPNCSMVIAGTFTDAQTELEAHQHEAWARVNYLGQISSSEIFDVLRQSKIGLLLLWPQSRFLESLPLKLFEYMGAGLPVIASSFPFWYQFVADNEAGIMVDPHDLDAIVATIQELLDSPQLVKKMGERAQEAVLDKYSWEQEYEKLVQVYVNIGSSEM